MDQALLGSIEGWWTDPAVARFAWVVGGLTVLLLLTRMLRRTLTAYISDNTTRYQARKAVGFLGYAAAAIFLALSFSDRLGGFTVALGVASAGIAFALQEVIASIAGWMAVSFGSFYKVGDRVQLGGIKGDVIDIGVLRAIDR